MAAAPPELEPKAPRVRFPGPCVEVPDEPFRILVTRHAESSRGLRYSLANRRASDFDRDGTMDVLVPHPRPRRPERGCPTEVEWVHITPFTGEPPRQSISFRIPAR